MICNYYHSLIPVVPEGLIQMMLGTPAAIYNGGLLHTHLCYFDPMRRRIGIPEGVAALVDRVSDDGAAVTLVNTDPTAPRSILVQSGMFGEHEFIWAQQDAEERVDIGGRWFRVELGPSAQTRLQLGLQRFAHRPAYGHPEFD